MINVYFNNLDDIKNGEDWLGFLKSRGKDFIIFLNCKVKDFY